MKIEPVSSNVILITTRQGYILEIMDSDELGLHISQKPSDSMLVLADRPYPQESDNLGLHYAITLIFPMPVARRRNKMVEKTQEPITFEGQTIEQWAALWKEENHKIRVLRTLIEKVNDIAIDTDSTGRLRAIKNLLVPTEEPDG